MNKKIIAILLLISCILLSSIFVIQSGADFGDISSNSDFGGGGYGGGSSGGSSYSGGDTYNYGGSGSGSGESSPVGIFVGLGIFALIIVLAVIKSKKQKTIMPGGVRTDESTLLPISSLKEKDPGFSEEDIIEKVSNLYVTLQNAWMQRDLEQLRPFLTDELFEKSDKQVQAMKQAHRTNMIERISVLSADVRGYTTDDVHDTLIIRLNTRIIDYTIDDNTKEVISGSKTAEKFLEYEWHMVRASGVQTKSETDGKDVKTANCPNCGAPIDIAHSAKCPYCGSVLHASEYSWVLSEIRGIQQRTNG